MKKMFAVIVTSGFLVAGLLVAPCVFAQNYGNSTVSNKNWAKQHPRRTQVNQRTKKQNKRINQGVRNGTLNQTEATQLKTEDRQIRQEERDMASQNGGHITKPEQKVLNRQENAVSHQIYQEKHDGK